MVHGSLFAARICRLASLLTGCVLCLLGITSPAASAEVELETSRARLFSSLQSDAALADVFFVDRAHGWAVGDRGVIWRTRDGGRSWLQQNSGVTCRLNSVCFIDERRGWAVGGESRPYARATRGVVLTTADGGDSWTHAPSMLPLLTRVKFFDENAGIAIGLGSQSLPSGVYVTRDSGQNWQSLPADNSGAWLAGDFWDAGTGAVAGPAGRFATIARQRLVHSPLATESLRSFRSMRLIAPTGGWIVGDGGLIMSTSDGGRSWQSTSDNLPANLAEHFDFHAVAVHGRQVWVAGSPGTRVFRTQDAGTSWQAFDTGHFAPIHAIWFVDDQLGWAVGDLGCILATHDGGCTWNVQRESGRRAAMLAVFASATELPLELIAQYGAAEGYITAVDVLLADADERGDISANLNAADAFLHAGASAVDFAWQFPIPAESLAPSPVDVLSALNRATDGRAIQQLERHLVRALRMRRPNVVVTHHAEQPDWGRVSASHQNAKPLEIVPVDSHAADALVENTVLRAIAAAADPAQFSELTSGVGLPPWQVNKVYGVLPAGSHGEERIDTDRFLSPLGASPADYVSLPRKLLSSNHAAPLVAIELKLLASGDIPPTTARGIFSGIAIAPGSDARRAVLPLAVEDVDEQRRLADRRRNVQQLLARSEGNAAWAAQVVNLTAGLDAGSAGELLLQLADGYRQNGNLDLAADSYFLFARQFPDHPLVDSALIWLVQFYASSEAAHRAAARGHQNAGPSVARGALTPEGVSPHSSAGEQAPSNEGLQQASAVVEAHEAVPTVGLSREDRLRRAVQLAEYFRTARPHLYAEPLVRFAEVTAQRQLGYPSEATRYFLSLRQLPGTDAWRRCATAEEWLASPSDTPPPKPLTTCRRTTTRPNLDGTLDEQFWQTADVVRLRDSERGTENIAERFTDASPPGHCEIRLSYDNEYLYLAISCPKMAGTNYERDEGSRPRDADLARHDRVELRLDLDRDFCTAYELTVDHRGWCRESCWGDANWNPRWFIAAAESESLWKIETAIPLAELTDNPPAARHVWALSAVRTVPRVGSELWAGGSSPADSPNHFGVLIFE
jgi:photosystem II stability/assembly factor-like uncharacterized protein